MHPGCIEGATHRLGAPEGWKPERDGKCGGLSVREGKTEHGHACMTSVWFPTPEEILAIVAGAPVTLCLLVGPRQHPPVAVGVGNAPE